MGNSLIAPFHPDQESLTEPGRLSALSDAVPGKVTAQHLMDGFRAYTIHPVDERVGYVVKTIEVTEHTPDDIEVKVILDGPKLDKYGYGDGKGTDRVHVWNRSKFTQDTVTCEVYISDCWLGEELKRVSMTTTAKLVQTDTKLRVEFYMETPNGERISDSTASGTADGVLEPILRIQTQSKVFVLADAPSPSDGSVTSIMSPALDEFADYDKFFQGCLSVFKTPPMRTVEFSEVSDSTFRLDWLDGEIACCCEFTHSLQTGEIAWVTNNNGKVLKTDYRKVHKSPLLFEAWQITDEGVRVANKKYARQVQLELNGILDTCASAGGWFS